MKLLEVRIEGELARVSIQEGDNDLPDTVTIENIPGLDHSIRARMSATDAVEFFRDVAECLEEAHQKFEADAVAVARREFETDKAARVEGRSARALVDFRDPVEGLDGSDPGAGSINRLPPQRAGDA